MDAEESYSYLASYLGPSKARTLISSCLLHKRSLEELYKHAVLLQCLKYRPPDSQTPTMKKAKPPVPKFEEAYKKVKSESGEVLAAPPYQQQLNIQCLYPVMSSEGSGYATCSSSNRSNSAHKVKVIKVIPESQPIQELAITSFGKPKFAETVDHTAFTLLPVNAKEKENEISMETIDHQGHGFSDVPIKTPPTSPTELDKKDMKKFEKFVELCEEYQRKLNITNGLVTEKFRQLAAQVIPSLPTHFKSKPFEAVAAAVLLYACREVECPVTLKQIVAITDSKEKLINKCVFSLKEILPSPAEVKRFKAGEFINVLADKLKIREGVRNAAIRIWENIERLNFVKSIHAVTLAACCLKFACALSEQDQEFEALAVVAGVTKMTLKNMYRELFPYRFYFITADCMLRSPQELKQC